MPGLASTPRSLPQTAQTELELSLTNVHWEQPQLSVRGPLETEGMEDLGNGRGLKPSSGQGEWQTVQ